MTTNVREPKSSRTRIGFRFLRRWPVFSVLILSILILAGAFAPLLAPHNPLHGNLRDRNAPPVWHAEGSMEHILGADPVGRDILSRIIQGARVSLMVVAVSLTTGIVIGTAAGLVSGYVGGLLDEFMMRAVDVWLGLPFILIALVIVVVMGQSMMTLIGVLALVTWSQFVRNVRGEVLSLKTRDYVLMARVMGASHLRIMIRHLLPGVLNTIIVLATLRVGGLILSEATLSFLGAGVPPPTPSWGGMVAQGRNYIDSAWWVSFYPGLAIFLVIVALNFLGDWFRDRYDPRLRQL